MKEVYTDAFLILPYGRCAFGNINGIYEFADRPAWGVLNVEITSGDKSAIVTKNPLVHFEFESPGDFLTPREDSENTF